MIIGLVGKKQSGKSTAAKYLASEYGFQELAFADKLKETLLHLFDLEIRHLWGTEEDKNEKLEKWGTTPRELMQWFGTDVLRRRWPDFHLHGVDKILTEFPNDNYIISDVRFKNEAKLVEKHKGILVSVERPGKPSRDRHSSEQLKIKTKYTISAKEGVSFVHKAVDELMEDISNAV